MSAFQVECVRAVATGALASYAQPGNVCDNTQAEAGWRTLKAKLLPQGGAFASLVEARLVVAHYLDRRHLAPG